VVREMVLSVARLCPFARQTTTLDPALAVKVRAALLDARDPYKLLFSELPAALELPLQKPEDAQPFAVNLGQALGALTSAYPRLLDSVGDQISATFRLPKRQPRARLRTRAGPLVQYAAERRLQAFVRAAALPDDGRDWREVLARTVNDGLPPTHWKDSDVAAFQVRLTQVAADFGRIEELVAERERVGASRIIRIGVLDGAWSEHRAAIPLPDDGEDVEPLRAAVLTLLEQNGATSSSGRARGLAALAQVVVQLINEPKPEGDEQL
jgi:hypothetical protein